MQLARDCTPYDLREFFNKGAGKVRDVKIIADRRASHRTKGIAYVEFREVESVMKVSLAVCANFRRTILRVSACLALQ
jgi:hypothetical protein